MGPFYGFLFIFGCTGLPILTVAVLAIWKPVPEEGEAKWSLQRRILWTLATIFILYVSVLGLPALPYFIWRIWRKPRKQAPPFAGRMGWTVTALGVGLTVATAVGFSMQEGDGDYRSWDQIRRHGRIFLAVSMTPLAGPLTAFLLSRRAEKKPPADPLDATDDEYDAPIDESFWSA